jgi:hypothetical protein
LAIPYLLTHLIHAISTGTGTVLIRDAPEIRPFLLPGIRYPAGYRI